jgi:hypothetical protein
MHHLPGLHLILTRFQISHYLAQIHLLDVFPHPLSCPWSVCGPEKSFYCPFLYCLPAKRSSCLQGQAPSPVGKASLMLPTSNPSSMNPVSAAAFSPFLCLWRSHTGLLGYRIDPVNHLSVFGLHQLLCHPLLYELACMGG